METATEQVTNLGPQRTPFSFSILFFFFLSEGLVSLSRKVLQLKLVSSGITAKNALITKLTIRSKCDEMCCLFMSSTFLKAICRSIVFLYYLDVFIKHEILFVNEKY